MYWNKCGGQNPCVGAKIVRKSINHEVFGFSVSDRHINTLIKSPIRWHPARLLTKINYYWWKYVVSYDSDSQ